MYSPLIQKLIEHFSRFPTVGPRTAARFVFYLLKTDEREVENLTSLIVQLKKKIKFCFFCFNHFEPSFAPTFAKAPAVAKALAGRSADKKTSAGKGPKNLCPICQSPSREKSLLCIVEKESDLVSLEKTKKYKGLYFILGGSISGIRKKDFEKLRTNELQDRIKNPAKFGLKDADFQEIILAVNLTTEGEATVLYLERKLKSLNKKITRLGRGLPVGGELEYADEETLSSALEGRK